MDSALFIGWGATVGGRERQAVQVFTDSMTFLTKLVADGRIASFEPFFLEPHGGDLEGFIVVRGDLQEIAKIRIEDDFQKLAVRAQVVVTNFGIVGAKTGEYLNKHIGWYMEAAKELG
jgi:hypothetical protein